MKISVELVIHFAEQTLGIAANTMTDNEAVVGDTLGPLHAVGLDVFTGMRIFQGNVHAPGGQKQAVE